MKKLLMLAGAMVFAVQGVFAQPVSDRAVVPVAVTLNQVLRINVVDGGNVEFVFNNIDQYKNGISNSAFYDTQITVASSTNWQLDMGAEDATFLGTDDPTNLMALDNVGFQIVENGAYTLALTNYTDPNASIAGVTALSAYPTTVISAGVAGNGGDVTDNDLTINWEAGTTNGTMNATSIVAQSLAADRYVTNVLFDLTAL